MTRVTYPLARTSGDERGLSGLETAIVLIAFTVVASTFAFGVLSSGLLSSEKSKSTVIATLKETSSTLVLRGTVLALVRLIPVPHVTDVKFQVTNALQSGESVNLSTSGVGAPILTYIDADQSVNLSTWTTSWLTGNGPLLDPGETVEISVDISGLSPTLKTSKAFSIQVKPTTGAALILKRTTPAELTLVLDLG